jgi:nucleotide-binding universal stress UspA family protein
MYKRVLVAVGDYPETDRPLDYAIALAAHTGAELCLLRVLTVPIVSGSPDMVACSTLAMDSLMEANEYVLAGAVEAAAQAHVPYVALLRWGAIPNAIVQTAEEAECDLIVVGAAVFPGWQRRCHGYITRKVAAHARQPVLAVEQGPPDYPAVSWWRRFLVVTGDAPSAEAATAYALSLAQEEDVDVCLLQSALSRPLFASSGAATRAHNALTLATAWAAAAGINYEVRHASGDGVTAIIETAAMAQCDAIILGAQGRPGWQRFLYNRMVKRVIACSPLPVLLVNHSVLEVDYIEQT